MNVAQAIKPLSIRVSFADFEHECIVALWLHIVNAFQLGKGVTLLKEGRIAVSSSIIVSATCKNLLQLPVFGTFMTNGPGVHQSIRHGPSLSITHPPGLVDRGMPDNEAVVAQRFLR
jgi:hypothetical protein